MTPFRVALILIAICGVAAWQVTVIPESLMQMTVGATLVPAVIVAGLALVSVLYGLSAWRGRQVDESLVEGQEALAGSQARLWIFLAGGALFMALVPFLGFWLPATVCGMCVARAFDAPWGLKSLLICGIVAAVFWTLFALVLGVGLGPALPFGF